MLFLNAHLLGKIGADTAENERNVAEILPKIGNYPGSSYRRSSRSTQRSSQPGGTLPAFHGDARDAAGRRGFGGGRRRREADHSGSQRERAVRPSRPFANVWQMLKKCC